MREKTELPAQRLEQGLPLGVVGGTELQLHGNVGGDVDGGVVCHHRSVGRHRRRLRRRRTEVGGWFVTFGGRVIIGDRRHQQMGSAGLCG
jgi:hypothetical protein